MRIEGSVVYSQPLPFICKESDSTNNNCAFCHLRISERVKGYYSERHPR